MLPQSRLARCHSSLLDDLTHRIENRKPAESVSQIQPHCHPPNLVKLLHGRSPFWASSPLELAAPYRVTARGGRPSHPISFVGRPFAMRTIETAPLARDEVT